MIRAHYTPVPTGSRSWERIAACGVVCSMRSDTDRGTSRVIYVRCRECVRRMVATFRETRRGGR